jgi:hypothetical protein
VSGHTFGILADTPPRDANTQRSTTSSTPIMVRSERLSGADHLAELVAFIDPAPSSRLCRIKIR